MALPARVLRPTSYHSAGHSLIGLTRPSRHFFPSLSFCRSAGVWRRESWDGAFSFSLVSSRRTFFSFLRDSNAQDRSGVTPHPRDSTTRASRPQRDTCVEEEETSTSDTSSPKKSSFREKWNALEYPFSNGTDEGFLDAIRKGKPYPRERNASAKSHEEHDHNGEAKADAWSPLIRFNPSLCPRSALFIPGHKPRALKKALGGIAADCFILDLEDAVGPGFKREAREGLRHFLEVDVPQWQDDVALFREETATTPEDLSAPPPPSPRFVVRINSPDEDLPNALLDLDFIASLGDRIEGVAIPKVSVHSYEKVCDYVHPSLSLWAIFETPSSILTAQQICASQRYVAAVMGYNDLSAALQLPSSSSSSSTTPSAADLSAVADHTTSSDYSGETKTEGEGIHHPEPSPHPPPHTRPTCSTRDDSCTFLTSKFPLYYAAMSVLYAARASGRYMFVLDGVYNDPTDSFGFQKDLRQCVSLGFHGKTLIHPSQVKSTNAMYCPSAQEVEWAKEIESAMAASHGNVTTLHGKMIETLHVRQAKRIVELADNAMMEGKSEEMFASIQEKNKKTRS